MKTSTVGALALSCLVPIALAAAAPTASTGPLTDESGEEWVEAGTLDMTFGGLRFSGPQEFSTRFGSGTIQPAEGPSCELPLSFEGSTATVPAGHSCTMPVGAGGSLTLVYQTGTFTRDGDAMTHFGTGEALYTGAGRSVAGTFVFDSVLMRAAP